jgi:hypothetical protein
MNKPLVAALLGVSILAISINAGVSASAQAQASMDVLCSPRPNAIPCVRDATGKIVGIPSYATVSRQIKGKWYSLTANAIEIPEQGLYYYSGPNCTGQVYVITKYSMPEAALYDGDAIFAAADNTNDGFDWQSHSTFAKANRGGQCTNYGPNCIGQGKPCHASSGGPVTKIEIVHFESPLKMQ